jgi:thioredoxin-related protein
MRMTTETPAPKRPALDTAANVAIIVACAAAVLWIGVQVKDRFSPPKAPPQPGQVARGEVFPELKGVVPAGAPKALVMALSPTCRFCTESMPFYKRLVDERNAKGSAVKVIAAVPAESARAEESAKLSEAGVSTDGVVALDFAKVKVAGTPTILLVDKQGKVLGVWVGKLDGRGEKDVLKAL